MAMRAIRRWFGTPDPRPVHASPPRVVAGQGDSGQGDGRTSWGAPMRPSLGPLWPPERIAITGALWGEGYQDPGGEPEVLRLARPLGLSAASSLLLLGAGSGGPGLSIAAKLGGWVSGFEADPGLLSGAASRVAGGNLAKRVQIAGWSPEAPSFRRNFYHHAIAIEALRGAAPGPVLTAIGASLKATGQFTMTEVVAGLPFDPRNRAARAWARMERRDAASVPSEAAITDMLTGLGFDVRVAEDISRRHVDQAMSGWRAMVQRIEQDRPGTRELALYVKEAEHWLHRLRLFQMGALRLVRWHAISGG